jgi:hypothetical protein
VETFEEEEEIDIVVVQAEIAALENELKQVRMRMDTYLNELELV